MLLYNWLSHLNVLKLRSQHFVFEFRKTVKLLKYFLDKQNLPRGILKYNNFPTTTLRISVDDWNNGNRKFKL